MSAVELSALVRQVEDLVADPKATAVPTGDAGLDASLIDFRAVWYTEKREGAQTESFWN
jgi:hypothetical protein